MFSPIVIAVVLYFFIQGPEHGPGEAVSECPIQEEHTAPHSHFPHPLLGRRGK